MKLKKLLSGFLAAAIMVTAAAVPSSAVSVKSRKLPIDKLENAWNAEVDNGKITFKEQSSAAGWQYYGNPQDFSAYDEIAITVDNNKVDLTVNVGYFDGSSNTSPVFSKSKGTIICPLDENLKRGVTSINIGEWDSIGTTEVVSASVRESADKRKTLNITYKGDPFKLTMTKDGIDGGRLSIFANDWNIKRGETTLGELKKMYKSFSMNGFVYKNDSLNLGQEEYGYYMFIRTQDSKTDLAESFYGSPTAMLGPNRIIWELDSIDGSDDFIIKDIGIAIFSGSVNNLKLKEGTVFTVNAVDKDIAVPKSVKAKAISKSEISVSWKSTGAKSYNVYRSISKNGSYVKIGTTSKTSFTDEINIPGYIYFYKVTSVKDGKDSNYSSIVSETAGTPAPKGIEVKKLRPGPAKITWDPSDAPDGSKPDGYKIYMSESEDGEYKCIADVSAYSDELSYTKSGLKKGGTYYFKICSYNFGFDDVKLSGKPSNAKSVEV